MLLKNIYLKHIVHINGHPSSQCTRAGGGGGLEPRTAIEGSFSAWGGLGKLDRGLGRGEPFFPDSDSDSHSDETFQISQKLGRVHVEFFCLLDSQPCPKDCIFFPKIRSTESHLSISLNRTYEVMHKFWGIFIY
jgi:hypothetical protein